jgi:hypothetical protein
MSSRKSFVRRLSAFVGLLIFSLAYAELFIRLFDPQPIMPRYVTGTPYGIRGNIPGAHYWHTTPEVDVEFKINSFGMRDTREFAYTKAPGVCRVAIFGDSFFMGYELSYEDTFAHQLEAELRSRGVNAEVLNFAVSGFGTAEMIRAYQALGSRFHPDIVMFQWHSTDPDDNLRSGLFQLENGRLRETNRPYLPSIAMQDMLLKWKLYRLVADHSHLYSFIRESVAKAAKKALVTLRGAGSSIDANAATIDTSEENQVSPTQRILLSSALLTYARELVASEGRSFYVVEIPTKQSRTEFSSSISALPQETRSALAIISPLQAFRQLAAPDRKIFFEQGQGHITPAAVQALVDVAAATLSTDPHLQTCSMGSGTAQPAVHPLTTVGRSDEIR